MGRSIRQLTTSFGALNFLRLTKKQEGFSCLKMSASSPQHKCSRLEVDEKMGHEDNASPNPRAMCCNFQLSAHCQVCWHQRLSMCERCSDWRGEEPGEGVPGVLGIKDELQLGHKVLTVTINTHQAFCLADQGIVLAKFHSV